MRLRQLVLPTRAEVEGAVQSRQAEVERLFRSLRERLPGVQAFLLLSSGGELLGHSAHGSLFDLDTFAAEYAMLLRIARRTSEDTGMGNVEEQILITASSQIVVLRFPLDHFGVFVCSQEEQLGRLRYELKRSLLYSSFSHL